MNWSPRRTLIVGVSLILVVNAIAVIGVAYNRGGEPESVLRLSERELRSPYRWGWGVENSGLSLDLLWRVLTPDQRNVYYGFAGRSAPATWLDASKLSELGIQSLQPSATEAEKRRYEKMESKEVLLVLELNGRAYQTALQTAQERADQKAGGADLAQKLLKQEQYGNSRLFVIDAGLDVAQLRAKYPDRARYAIVHGRIRPPRVGYCQANFGSVEALTIEQVSVPVEFRSVFAGLPKPTYPFGERDAGPEFEAAVAIGRRLEPWLFSARRLP